MSFFVASDRKVFSSSSSGRRKTTFMSLRKGVFTGQRKNSGLESITR